tara:strand:- start:7969 stop:8553 length:585 start_codon:yes stop_codon:yes gene_type:complete
MENEILNKLRQRLSEEVNKITRLEVFDFDGTLISTPLPENGISIWEKAYGKEWPHTGWWSRLESLDQDIFEMRALPQVTAAYQAAAARPDTMKIMMTGRRGGRKYDALMAAVKSILDKKGLVFDGYYYNYKGETSEYKIGELNKILSENPNIVDVVLYDDRVAHEPAFQEWGKSLLDNGRLKIFTFNLITSDHH